MALRERHRFRCRVSHDDGSEEMELEELAIMNAPVLGGFLGLRVSGVRLDDERLDVLAIGETSVPRLALAGLYALLGIRLPVRGIRALHVGDLHVETEEALEVTLDGEVLGSLPATFEVAADALRMVTPADFDGR